MIVARHLLAHRTLLRLPLLSLPFLPPLLPPRLGAPPLAMPLIIGAVACPLSVLLLACVHAAPRPDAADVAARSRRSPMTAAARIAFLLRFGPGLACMLLGYAILVGVRP